MNQESWLTADGVFETLRTYENLPFALDLHLERLERGIKEIGIIGVDRGEVESEVENELLRSHHSSGHLRIVVNRSGKVAITHKSYEPPIRSLKCLTIYSSIGKGLSYKSTDYQGRFDLRDLAINRGFDDAILVSSDGSLVESTTCNLIILTQEGWITPPLSSGCLPGITRRLLLENFGVREREIKFEEIDGVRAIAVTSSLREIQSIEEVDGKVFPNSRETEVLKTQFHSWILGNLAL
jgi:branched-chain amino acid aminotransferase